MENRKVKIDEIRPNNWNPNEMVDDTYNYLVDSKNWFGNLQDILLWQQDNGELMIIDGEHRWKADRQLNKTEIDAKILTTDELLSMADGLVELSQLNPEYQNLTDISKITNKQEKAHFIAKSLTLIMNAIKGENNPIKLAKLFKEMNSNTSILTLSKLIHMGEDDIKNYELLLEMSNEEMDKTLKTIKDKPTLNEVKLIFNDEEFDVFNQAIHKTGITNISEAALEVAKQYLDIMKEE